MPEALEQALFAILGDPESLAYWASNCEVPECCRFDTVGQQLSDLIEQLASGSSNSLPDLRAAGADRSGSPYPR